MFELRIDEKRPVEEENSQKRTKKQPDDEEKNTIMRTALFRKIIESVAEIVDDVDIKITQDGLSIQFMDAMNVTMMNVFLPESTFDMFRCDKPLTLGLKIKEFLKVMRVLKIEANTSFYLRSEDNPEFLNIKFETEACTSDYIIKLQNIGSESYDIPAIEFTAEAEMKSSDFLVMRQSAGNFAEYITIEASDSSINFSQSGEMIGSKTKTKTSETGKYDIRVNITEDVSVEISMKYMNCITKTAGYCPNVRMCLGVNAPVFFEFKLKEGGHINYFIAPKMDDE
ncbi:DNA polymerase delta processivity factor (proliferating cell nuclear antigen) [Pseudoloma neurophilia]|uniref:DNA sliding clamp PCNA n=1 Tax=Pseudoloma neurophilia TaxID=146866 RepID=A0A0R0M2E1_9MICR|nr:DNA polymerase delta processivity factor (proliferating cell nuclear antigen) [Pseudoloma neurophilia]